MEIPVFEKYVLSIEEAAAYFNIGMGHLRRLVKQNLNAVWVIWNGTHVGIKRKAFEKDAG